MLSFRVPGSSEPVRGDADSNASSITSEADPRLSAVPQHPHVSGRPVVEPPAAASSPRHELASFKHPVIPRQSQRATKGTDDALETDTKRKSIGSKLLSKFRHHSSDDKHEHSAASDPRSQVASGSQTPSRSPWASDSKKPFRPDNLEQALATEQHRRSKSKQASFGSIDGIRQRKIFGSRKSKARLHDSDIESHDEHSESEAAPHYLSSQPANLDLVRSDATRHFPGGLYDVSRDTPPEDLRRSQATSAPLHAPASLEDPDIDVFAPVGDGGDGHDDLFLADHHQDYDSDGSDDTIAHLIREADGYDSLRFNSKGEVAAGLDYDLLHAAREKERSLSENKDAQSGYSAYSGGASKALSQPLLELEDIELETFLQNFARHTREVTVTRPSGNQKYRMPKWSDFRVSPDDDSAAVPDRKRPSMLTRVDRGLHHLSESLEAPSIAKAGTKLTGEGRTSSGTGGVSRSRSTDDDLDAELHPQPTNMSSPNKKKEKAKTLKKQHSSKGKASSAYTVEEEEDEDWDLVVPSSGDDARHAMSLRDELRVNAEDEGVDGVAFCIAYILALVEKLAPEEIDHHPDRGYREGLIRSHLERLYTIAPFWENLAFRLRRLYRWEDPKTTAAAAMIYFVLWYTNMIPTAFILTIMFYIMRFKYFPPSESYLHEKVMMRMARGKAANTLSEKLRRRSRLDILNIYKRWIVTFGAPTQEAMGLVADFHEKVKNLILWRNSAATRRTLILFGVLNLFVTFAPSQYVSKAIFFFLGITFFCLLPLQSYFPSHRKALSPLWWATFGAPTDAQFAVQLLRKRHLDIDRFAGQLSTAEDVRRAVRSPGASKLKPRPDRREEGIAYGDIEDPSRASFDYVETTKDATLKPRKLGSFFCQYKGLPGRLHVNTKYLYFTPLHSPSLKRGRTPVVAIESLIKTKSIRLMVWSSLGLKIVRNNGKAPLLLANVQHRDEAFNLILAVSTNDHSTCRAGDSRGDIEMQDQVDRLVSDLLEQVKRLEGGRRVLVGISGIPGSGKSLLAVNLVRALNSAWKSRSEGAGREDVAICVGMDGWHYPRSVLSTFPNAQEAFDRRGAEWTFDAKRFADFVATVKITTSTPLYAPSFDHAKKDPLEDDVAVLPSHRVAVFEGLYCNCDVGEWKRAAEQFDVRLVFEISKQDAKTRLITRHVATGVAKDTEEAIWRADNNDLPNGDWLMSHLLAPYTVVTSIDDPSWR